MFIHNPFDDYRCSLLGNYCRFFKNNFCFSSLYPSQKKTKRKQKRELHLQDGGVELVHFKSYFINWESVMLQKRFKRHFLTKPSYSLNLCTAAFSDFSCDAAHVLSQDEDLQRKKILESLQYLRIVITKRDLRKLL